jgi:hypothetical protein
MVEFSMCRMNWRIRSLHSEDLDSNLLSQFDRSNQSNQSDHTNRPVRCHHLNHSVDQSSPFIHLQFIEPAPVPLQPIEPRHPDQSQHNQLNLAASLVGFSAFSLNTSSTL